MCVIVRSSGAAADACQNHMSGFDPCCSCLFEVLLHSTCQAAISKVHSTWQSREEPKCCVPSGGSSMFEAVSVRLFIFFWVDGQTAPGSSMKEHCLVRACLDFVRLARLFRPWQGQPSWGQPAAMTSSFSANRLILVLKHDHAT